MRQSPGFNSSSLHANEDGLIRDHGLQSKNFSTWIIRFFSRLSSRILRRTIYLQQSVLWERGEETDAAAGITDPWGKSAQRPGVNLHNLWHSIGESICMEFTSPHLHHPVI
jgi:hypothetical protein